MSQLIKANIYVDDPDPSVSVNKYLVCGCGNTGPFIKQTFTRSLVDRYRHTLRSKDAGHEPSVSHVMYICPDCDDLVERLQPVTKGQS